MVDCVKNLNANLEKIIVNQKPSYLHDFYGNITDFPIWINEYERSANENKISISKNLSRLQICLRGKARDVIRDLFCSSENVPTIIETLKMHFGT